MTNLSITEAKRALERIDTDLRDRISSCTSEEGDDRDVARRAKQRALQQRCARLRTEVDRLDTDAQRPAVLAGEIAALEREIAQAFA